MITAGRRLVVTTRGLETILPRLSASSAARSICLYDRDFILGADAGQFRVENGEVSAALIIPPDFSAQVDAPDPQGAVEVLYNPGAEISATIILAVIQQITAGLNGVIVAQDVLVDGEAAYFPSLAANPAQIGQAMDQVMQTVATGEAAQLVILENVPVQGDPEGVNLLSYFAPGMAILFMTFAMAAGTREILDEQRTWTMQRIISTPTPRWVYLVGRLVGTYITGFLQMLILLLITPLVATLTGGHADVWGDNYLGLALITLTVVLAATGLGLLIAGVSKSVEQADMFSTAALFLLAMVGGAFIPVDDVPLLQQLRFLTLNYWGLDGYFDLAVNNASVGDILPNSLALVAMGGVFFLLALWRFNKRLNF
ncbi:MAG: ABC transporter permease [Anaerolineae bacterium]|nr:ABC transporter permease [Anaerolineae bacterium]